LAVSHLTDRDEGDAMRLTAIACAALLAVSCDSQAAAASSSYGQQLLEQAIATHPGIVAGAISAVPPKSKRPVIAASTDRAAVGSGVDTSETAVPENSSTSVSPSPSGDRLIVRLPLRDVSGDAVGVLRLEFASTTNSDRAAVQRQAEAIRDQLHRHVSHAGNLFDPYPYEPEAPANTFAQHLVDDFLERYPEIQILAIHATPPESDYNIIAGSNIGRIGKKADNDDMRCVYTGKPNLEVNSTGKRFESEMQLHDRAGHVVGAVGVVVAYKQGDDKAALHARAERIRAEMEKRIPDAASLFQPPS
jgi:hypothetical protein